MRNVSSLVAYGATQIAQDKLECCSSNYIRMGVHKVVGREVEKRIEDQVRDQSISRAREASY